MAQHNEKPFEDELCAYLAARGWLYSPNDDGYDRGRALFPEDLLGWLEDTQPVTYAGIVKPSMSEKEARGAQDKILDRVVKVLDTPLTSDGGTLNLLRGGFKVGTSKRLDMSYPRPATSLNPKAAELYGRTRVRVMRQVHFATAGNHTVDMVLFINGLPVATVELKTDFTQSVDEAMAQYRRRDPRSSPLFGWGTRAVVHFAVSNAEVWMTTKLAGPDTRFLPFNRGDDGHAGNPRHPGGSDTAYLWERVWDKDTWLDIILRFAHVETSTHLDANARPVKSSTLIFPRFHQWEAVTEVLADARTNGAGQSYLIEHSAGSGKTRTIAWTAHRLLSLHDEADQKIFDSVIVVTDRTVLDDQLQAAVKQIERTTGTVLAIDRKALGAHGATSKSQLLQHGLLGGRKIIVVTLQTFPAVLELLNDDSTLAGRRYAVIADEAHSSQTGSAATKLKKVLTPSEQADLDDGGEVDTETLLAAEMEGRARPEHISFLAFTATPKGKTLQLFGRPGEDVDERGNPIPVSFHLYPMQQAIEEDFILDVLRNFTNYDTAFQLAIKVEQGDMVLTGHDPDDDTVLVDQHAATKGLIRWVKLHPTNIAQKVQIIVEHYRANIAHLLDGKAKAMVVTDSRKAAVRYKTAMDAYITKMGYKGLSTLVAFSGDVDDPETGPNPFTEANMNPGVTGNLAAAFATDGFQVMIVANKYQTGFDQPLLCAMYVDRQLSGVTAVQTLSRLNRTFPGKSDTYVLDFVNSEEEILEAFKPYYAGAELAAVTDPDLIHDLQGKLDASGMYTTEEVDAVVDAWVRQKGNNAITGALGPIVHRFRSDYQTAMQREDKARLDELDLFRKDLRSFINLYDFLSQIVEFGDTEPFRRSIAYRLLEPLIHVRNHSEITDLSGVDLVAITQKHKSTSDLVIEETKPVRPVTAAGSGTVREIKKGPLAEVIERLNEIFGGEDFSTDQQETWLEGLIRSLMSDEQVREQAEHNSKGQFLASPTLRTKVLLAVFKNQAAHEKMSQIIHQGGQPEKVLVEMLGELIHHLVREE
ncbi:type I restriction endonuclease subunit R [Ornithinimicrobium ciconiae]|uniref:Type I restriction endonuclease subunit R n=1 Tax=Ornithinimicrobium ciconiae TaxID=2594265 RepID=A0A516GEH3_9MICO|nr:DEAD/DEAH box helicase family protein [Ornithinimicrobium ciconiae]QDO89933.1 type I restriction endonuclease subunit R [Ornithinimicrobium ciconiae]